MPGIRCREAAVKSKEAKKQAASEVVTLVCGVVWYGTVCTNSACKLTHE
jgi:hypothetical protein